MKLVKIAVTGGIGSGKSFVINLIEKLGYPTVSCDCVYAELLSEEKFVLEVCKEIRVEPLYVNGKAVLNKKLVSEKVFLDKSMLNKLNSLTHKAIFDRLFSLSFEGLAFYEVPLLFEGNYQDKFDYIFVVMRDIDERIASAMKRDNCTKEEVERKIKNQFDYENADLSLHTVIYNDCDEESLKIRVVEAIKNIEKKEF